MQDFIQNINPKYFWDINIDDLNTFTSKRLIIERVFTFGNLIEIKLVFAEYGKQTVVHELCNLNYIDPKTLVFISLILGIPKKKFKCYKRRLLSNQHWN
ncbi:MAG: DUF6922 domain-containing protein [Bacteroidales bacterium]